MNELVDKRTKNSKTFALGGNKYRLEVGKYSHAMKNGIYVPTDTLVEAENGTDSDAGMNYIARSRFENLDYDIRFGKNDPVWMKIKHLPTNKTVVFKPKNNTNKPDHVVSGNKIFVSQAWPGIDMEIFVTDKGTKTNYIITSGAGQRVIEFTVSGDISAAVVSRPWYTPAHATLPAGHPRISRVYPPAAIAGNVLSYDFRSVPIGTVIDPEVSFGEQLTDGGIRHNPAGTSWANTRNAAVSTEAPSINGGQPNLGTYNDYNGGSPYIDRAFLRFDTSGIPEGSTILSAAWDISLNASRFGDAESGWAFCKATWVPPMTSVQFGALNGEAVMDKNRTAAVANNITGAFTDLSFVVAGGFTPLSIRNYHDYANAQPSDYSYYNFLGSSYSNPLNRPSISVEYEEGPPPPTSASSRGDFGFWGQFRWRGWR